MLKVAGSLIVIIASLSLGKILSINVKTRICHINTLIDIIEKISMNVSIYKLPLEYIYTKIDTLNTCKRGSFYDIISDSGLLIGDEERDIIKTCSQKLGEGTAEDTVKFCSYTASRLRSLEEKLYREMPDKQKIYSTISLLAGASIVIILI